MSQITTHVLDTSAGRPAEGVPVALYGQSEGGWILLASGKTNSDGRYADLLKAGDILPPGIYRMLFNTGAYFRLNEVEAFYPEVAVVFKVTDDAHYHVPLLLNPFGYSTYRGS